MLSLLQQEKNQAHHPKNKNQILNNLIRFVAQGRIISPHPRLDYLVWIFPATQHVPGAESDQGQDQPFPSNHEGEHTDDQGQENSQDGDSNDQDDQEIYPRNNEEIEARRLAKMRRALKQIDRNLDNVAEDLAYKRT